MAREYPSWDLNPGLATPCISNHEAISFLGRVIGDTMENNLNSSLAHLILTA